MKLIKILIFVLILADISCECSNNLFFKENLKDIVEENGYIDPAASKSSWINREFSPEESEVGAVKCCYYNIDCKIKVDQLDPKDREGLENTEIKEQHCTTLTTHFYNNLLDNMKKLNLDSFLDCKAHYLECDENTTFYFSSSPSFSSSSSSSFSFSFSSLVLTTIIFSIILVLLFFYFKC